MKKTLLVLIICLTAALCLAGCGWLVEVTCDHAYDNACDATCNECGKTREDSAHRWKDATCTSPKTCTVCGATEGEMLAHGWEDATCTSPKTCKTCGATEGEALGHKPAEDDGDCTTPIQCAVCSEITTAAKTHDFDGAEWQSNETQHWHICKNDGCNATDEKINHTPAEDDGDCTTSVQCAVCSEITTAAKTHDFDGAEWQSNETQHWHICKNDGCNATDEKINHIPAEDDGDCTTPIQCTVCSEITTAAKIHDFDGAEWQSNETQHWHICKNDGCNATDEKINHIPDEDDGDCTTSVQCAVCSEITTAAKMHDFDGAEWQSNETQHWHICKNDGCNATDEKINHIPAEDDGDCTTAITCRNCGTVTTEAKDAHTPDADDGDCTTPIGCALCAQVAVAARTKHKPAPDDGDCTTAVICAYCDQITLPAKEAHVATVDPATCINRGICDECGIDFQELDPNNHESDGTKVLYYDKSNHATVHLCCGATASLEPHNGEATCSSYAYCTICEMGYEEPDPNNHASEDYFYIDNLDNTHNKLHECCGAVAVESEDHSFDASGLCICGAEVTASVSDGSTTVHTNMKDLSAEIIQLLESGKTRITVDLPEDAPVEMLLAVRRALIDAKGVVDGSVDLTLKGVTRIPVYNGFGIFGAWITPDSSKEITALGSITLTDATYIESNTFYYANYLSRVSAPLLTEIAAGTFNCSGISEVYFPRVEKVGGSAFDSCYNLSEISLPSAKEIRNHAFCGCDNLTKVSLPSASVIGSYVFQSSKNITELTLGELTSVDDCYAGIFNGGADTKNIRLNIPCTQKAQVLDEDMYWVPTDVLYSETEDYQNNVFMRYTFASVTLTHDFGESGVCVCGERAPVDATAVTAN